MESLLTLGVACFSHTHQDLQEAVLLGVRCVGEYYTYLNSTQANLKKVFLTTCQQLLSPALQLHGLIRKVSTLYQVDLVPRVIGVLENIFKSLFRR